MRKQKKIYDVTVVEFSTYEEANKNVPKGDVLLANMSKFCTKLLASQLSQFCDVEYTRQEIGEIINNKDVERFQGICPLYFRSMNMMMSEEQEKFFVENLSYTQLIYIPLNVFKALHADSIKVLIKRLRTESIPGDYHKKFYYVHHPLADKEPDKYVFYAVKDVEMCRLAMSQFDYVARMRTIVSDDPIDYSEYFSKDYIPLRIICKYMVMNYQYLKYECLNDEESNFFKYLQPKLTDTPQGELLVPRENFIRFLKVCYNKKDATDEDVLQKDGVFDWRYLAKLENVQDTLTHVHVFHNYRTGKLHGFKFSDRIVRFTKKDFEEFLANRKERKFYAHSVIQFPMNITEKDKQRILSDYIEEKELYQRLSFSIKDIDELDNFRCLPMVQKTRAALVLYTYRGGKCSYYRKDAVNEFMQTMYGINKNGHFITGRKFDIDLVKDVARQELTVSKLCERYPVFSNVEVRIRFINLVQDGKIPYIKAGERRHLFIWTDVVKAMDKEMSRK